MFLRYLPFYIFISHHFDVKKLLVEFYHILYAMPRSFKKRVFKRRRYSSKGRRAARIARARRRRRSYQTKLLRGPVNTTCVAKLAYCTATTLTPSAGLQAAYVMNANSLYDPDRTGTGHQPMGFDEIMANYNHFTVIGSKITVDFIGANEDFLAAIYLSGNLSDGSTNAEEVKERRRTRYKLVTSTTENHGRCRIVHKFSAKKFFHVKAIVGESQYRGSATNSPAEEAYFYIQAGPDDQSATVGTIKLSIRIEYLTVFSEPKSIGQS